MKKTTYFFFALCVALFCALPLSAQIYSHPVHRSRFYLNRVDGDPDHVTALSSGLGGSAIIDWRFTHITFKSREVVLLDKDCSTLSFPITPTMGSGQIHVGYLCDAYYYCVDDVIEVTAGEELFVEGTTSNGWANASLFVDWDGNGVFDDHDVMQYNLYNESCNVREEFSDASVSDSKCYPRWTIKVPDSFLEEKKVRCRIRYDEGVRHLMLQRFAEINTHGIPGCSNDGRHTNGGLAGTKQYFYSMAYNRFMPSANGFRGTILDFDLTIKPNEFVGETITSRSYITETGAVSCTTTEENAISNEADFETFLNASNGNFYLTQDITISNTLDVSQTTFSGTFDGNGHTITIAPAATTTSFTASSKDMCFYPYGTNADAIKTSIKDYDWAKSIAGITSFPNKTIGGGFCGVLANAGTIKNVKVVYKSNCTYQGGGASIFGLIAGIAKGRIENVSVDIQNGNTIKVESDGTTVAACGAITGILFRGIIKNCDVNIDGTLNLLGKNSNNLPIESALGGFVGRLQAGVIGNVKFSGAGTLALAAKSNITNSRYYIGGIAGMTNTPQGTFCTGTQTDWGYDNGTLGLDVNNVILSFTGSMDMGTAKQTVDNNFYCRGLLFAEATDTTTVPNLITQYATRPTIESASVSARSITGTDIPLISTTKGSCGADGKLLTGVHSSVGKLYLYKDGRDPANSSNCQAFTNVTVADTKLDWAYEVQTLSNGSCVSFSTPYAVATNTTASAAGIANASANVSDLGNAVVKIDPQPATTPNPSWTWSNAATPTTPAVEPLVCTGGGGTSTSAPTYTIPTIQHETGTNTYLTSITSTGATSNVSYSASSEPVPGTNNQYVLVSGEITAEPGQSITLNFVAKSLGSGSYFNVRQDMRYMTGTLFTDFDRDGIFDLVQSWGNKPPTNNVYGNYDYVMNISRTITIPTTASIGKSYIRMYYRSAWEALPTDGTDNGKGIVYDIVINVVNPLTYPTYCTGTVGTERYYGIGSGYVKVNGVKTFDFAQTTPNDDFSATKVINICSGDNITFGVSGDLGNKDGGKHIQWAKGVAYFDWNQDGDWNDANESYELFDNPNKILNNEEYSIIVPNNLTNGVFKMRLCSGEAPRYNSATDDPCNAYPKGCLATFGVSVNCGTGTCKYVHDFGEVGVGDTATYTMPIGEAFTITTGLGSSPFTATQNGTDLVLNYNPTAAGNHTGKLVINYGGNNYDVELTGKGVNFPTLTFQIGEDGGGSISTDMGKTTDVTPIVFTNYHGELLTAVPQGPCAIEGWYVDEGDGNGFVKQTDPVTHSDIITPDFTYTGTADNVTVEVRFKFEDFEGNFGNSRFTDNTHLPFYISTIKTDGGIVNVNATNVFTAATVAGGSAHLNYLTDQRLQTLTKTLGAMSHEITVTVENADSMPANARLLCFIDYNYNGWFDFKSSADGLASNIEISQIGDRLVPANPELSELVYVGAKGDGVVNGSSITFKFTINNDSIKAYGKTRMRFMVATYVDMYGLGPVNQYGNYQPRFDTDGDGVADAYLPLNDSNGSLYSPNNECRYENYINVADVNFEVVAYIKATDTYIIEAGTSTRMGDLYIESVEDGSGIHSGRIIFDKGNPTGSLQVEGNIVVRKCIYQDRWHHIAFPIDMQGSSGTKGICAVDANGGLHRLSNANWVLATFNPANRNTNDGYNGGTEIVKEGKASSSYSTLSANTFYEFAADNAGGAVLGSAPVNHYWIQFHSVDEGFHITAKSAQTVEIDYTRMESANQYWNRNVFTIYNPYLSPINVKDITASVGWENITWKNAYYNRYEAVSAADTCNMPPYFGYWVQFTEGIGSNPPTPIKVTLGAPNRTGYAAAEHGIVTVTPMSTTGAVSSFDTPDAYTLGIDRAAATLGKQAASRTIVTLTDAGSVDEFRAGYDMPVSYAAATSTVPEIWSKAGSSRMMFNDVMRDNEVVVPVGIRIKEAGEYVIRLTHTNFAESLVQLYDKQTGARVDLQRNGELFSYNFLADAGDADSRFDLIIIAPESMTDLEVIEQDEVPTAAAIYKAGSTLRIVNMPLGYTVSVCDVIGREVLHTTVVDADMQLELPNSQGVYLVNVRNEKGAAVQVLKLAR